MALMLLLILPMTPFSSKSSASSSKYVSHYFFYPQASGSILLYGTWYYISSVPLFCINFLIWQRKIFTQSGYRMCTPEMVENFKYLASVNINALFVLQVPVSH
jgi:hypothetical protein